MAVQYNHLSIGTTKCADTDVAVLTKVIHLNKTIIVAHHKGLQCGHLIHRFSTHFDGSADCDFPPANTVESSSHFMGWTPQEINASGSSTASGDAVITYTAYDGDTVLTEGTFNVIMTDGEFDGDYIVDITEPFTVDDGGFIVLDYHN